jgi:uncharacterized RDD family membrane protein YckC
MAYCANCGHQISDQAPACPSCGHPRVAAPMQGQPIQVRARPPWPGANLGLPQDGPNSLAGPGQRLLARILDSVIIGVAFFILFFVIIAAAGGLEQADEGLGGLSAVGFIVPFAGLVLYEVGLTATRGQTVGKMALGIRVVDEATGQPPGWGPSFVRWVVPLVMGFVPFLTLVDALWLLWDANRQCLHDKAAKTLVIRIW